MDNYIDSMIYALNNGLIRAKYYKDTGESRFLVESNEWMDVAKVYMNEINRSNIVHTAMTNGSLDFSPIGSSELTLNTLDT